MEKVFSVLIGLEKANQSELAVLVSFQASTLPPPSPLDGIDLAAVECDGDGDGEDGAHTTCAKSDATRSLIPFNSSCEASSSQSAEAALGSERGERPEP